MTRQFLADMLFDRHRICATLGFHNVIDQAYPFLFENAVLRVNHNYFYASLNSISNFAVANSCSNVSYVVIQITTSQRIKVTWTYYYFKPFLILISSNGKSDALGRTNLFFCLFVVLLVIPG